MEETLQEQYVREFMSDTVYFGSQHDFAVRAEITELRARIVELEAQLSEKKAATPARAKRGEAKVE
jgi:hypothetical protein